MKKQDAQPSLLDHLARPIPILQWLVVVVLCAHAAISHDILGPITSLAFIITVLSGNACLLYAASQLMSMTALSTTLVIVDTLLVPWTLYATETATSDLFIAYFGIIMLAGTTGSLKRSLLLSAITSGVYLGLGIFALSVNPNSIPINLLILRVPLLMIMTLFYGGLAEYAERERRHKERLSHDVAHDELTGLPNRRHIMEALARALDEAKRFNTPLSCAVLDLDGFKKVNDTQGHDIGDQVLKDYAVILGNECRGYDVAGRQGGDEFIWFSPRGDRMGMSATMERIRHAVEQHPFKSKRHPLRLTTSIGFTTYYPGKSEHPTPTQILKVADLALYSAKREGRNRVFYLSMVMPEPPAQPQKPQ